jgi:hypothetical protein
MVGGFAEGERFGSRYVFHAIGIYSTDEEAAGAPYDEKVNAYWLGRGKVAGDTIWEDRDGNGRIDDRDVIFVGYVHPDKMGAMVNTWSWKGLSLRFAMDFSAGNVVSNDFRAQLNGSTRNNNAILADILSDATWKKPGDVATLPRFDVESDWDFGKRNNSRPATALGSFAPNNSMYVKKGDYLAFRELSLSYRLQTEWLRSAGLYGIEFTAAMYNLGYWTAYDGLTPEFTGSDTGRYPRPRQFMFSARLTF